MTGRLQQHEALYEPAGREKQQRLLVWSSTLQSVFLLTTPIPEYS
jgi:hypothetical protein